MSLANEQPLDMMTLDTKGLNCPEPIMMLHQVMRKMVTGQCVMVQATDPSTTRDIPKFCMHLGHELVSVEQNVVAQLLVYTYKIIKG